MTITPNAIFLGYDGRATIGVKATGIYLANGPQGTVETVPLPIELSSIAPASSIVASAALAYTTVFSEGGLFGGEGVPAFEGPPLYATDLASGMPQALAVPTLASAPTSIVALGSLGLFAGQDVSGNFALWRTDGTSSGTFELRPPGAAANFAPMGLAVFGGSVLFAATASDGSMGLWSSDGTNAGTVRVAVLPSATSVFRPVSVTGGKLIFVTGDPSANLWSTDGTAAGTVEFAPLSPGALSGFTLPNGLVVFTDGASIFSTDGIHQAVTLYATSHMIEGFYQSRSTAGHLVPFGSEALFGVSDFASSGPPTFMSYVTDGTPGGTNQIAIPASSVMFFQRVGASATFGTQLLFGAFDPNPAGNQGLYISLGSSGAAQQLAAGINPAAIVTDGSHAVVLGTSSLYVTDGTTTGTAAFAPVGNLVQPVSFILDPTHIAVTGTRAQYALSPTASGALQIADLVANRDGAATYPGARVVVFSDGTGVLDPTGNAEAVARVYEAAYGRAPDIGGLVGSTMALDGGTVSLAQIASIASDSYEFLTDYGALSDAGFVTRLYLNADGRTPDPGGLAAYTGALASGQLPGDVLLAIGESFEARQHSIGVAGDANDATVYRLYEAVDGRAPDPSGQAAYSAALASGQNVAQLAGAFLASGEYAQTFGLPDNATFVTELYTNLLHRTPDAGGLAGYSASLASGTSRAAVVAAFVGGDEGRLVTAPATHDGWVSVS